jgi:hypothetical protein
MITVYIIQITFRIETLIILKGSSIHDLRNTYFRTVWPRFAWLRVDENFKINTGTFGEYNLATLFILQRPLITFTIKKLKNNRPFRSNFKFPSNSNHGNEDHIRQFLSNNFMGSCGVFYVEPATWYQQFPWKWNGDLILWPSMVFVLLRQS